MQFNFRYVEYYGLKEPTDKILDLLVHIAKANNKIAKVKGFANDSKKMYDIDGVAIMLIKDYFDGRLGKSFLDEDCLEDALGNDEDELELNKFV